MSRCLKALCVSAATVLVLAISASAAAAVPVGFFIAGEKSEEKEKQPRFEAESYPATVKGTSKGPNLFFVQFGTLECNNVQFAGWIVAASTALTVQPTFASCTFGGLTPTVFVNGCGYVFNVSNVGPGYLGTTNIACAAGKEIELVLFGSGVLKCTIKVPSQTGLSSVYYANMGSGSSRNIATTLKPASIKYSQVAGTGPGKCTAGEFTNGFYSAPVVMSAEK